jgi:hypothetical protein
LAQPEISRAICFPFAQHYIADSPGCYTTVKDRDDMITKYNEIAEAGISKTFSARTIVKQLFFGVIIILLIVVALLILF